MIRHVLYFQYPNGIKIKPLVSFKKKKNQTISAQLLYGVAFTLNFLMLSLENIKLHTTLQGILLDILVALGIIRSQHFWLDVEHIQEGIQNVLVIVEMVFFAIFMRHAYSAAPYRQEAVTSSGDKKKE